MPPCVSTFASKHLQQLFVAGGMCGCSHVRCQNSEKFILFLFSSPRMTLPTVKSMKLYSPQKAFLILYVLYFYFHICIRYIFKILPRVLGRYLEMYSS